MTRFWQRRIAVLLMIAGGLTALLYGALFVVPPKTPLPAVGMYSAIAGGIAALTGLYTFLKTAPEDLDENARFGYIVLVGLVATLIYETGMLASPLSILWGAIALTAPLFGGWGVLPVALISIGFPALQLFTGNITFTAAWQAAAVAVLPIFFGYLIKPTANTGAADTQEDRSYHALAKQLSQVAGKSEVVINAINDGVLAVNGSGIIELISPSAQRIVGWGKEDAVGLNYKSILKLVNAKGDEIDSAHDPVARTFTSNTTVTDNTLSLLTQSGKKLLVSVVSSPAGQPGSGAIVVFRDITNEKAEERQQAEFISTASHEMRTPVAEIEGYLGLALNPQTAQIDEKARDFITKAHGAAQHLGRLFQDLLDVSKAEDGRMQNNPKIVDVTKFMAGVVESLTPKAQAKGLTIVYKPHTGTGDTHERGIGRTINPAFYATVDNDHLREVADNLVENAIKYTPKGQVVVDVTGENQHVTISITDTGLGIPQEDVGHLFQKFYRVDNTETREIGGTGLGLYLCRRLVEAMNGRIWVESVFRQGSTFYVELPRTSGVEADRMVQSVENTLERDTTAPAPPVPNAPSALPSDEMMAALAATEPAPLPPIDPTAIPHPIESFPNTPLITIEQHPDRYIAQTEGRSLNIPRRQP